MEQGAPPDGFYIVLRGSLSIRVSAPGGDPGSIKLDTVVFKIVKDPSAQVNALLAGDVDAFPPELAPWREVLRGRSMLVRKTDPIPIECVARGYLSGSGWKDYQKTGMVCGIRLPAGLKEEKDNNGTRLAAILKRPEVEVEHLLPHVPELARFPRGVLRRMAIELKYEGYIAREIRSLEKQMLAHARNLEFEQAAMLATVASAISDCFKCIF